MAAVVLLRLSPFPRPGRALMHQFVLVDVVVVAAKVVPAGCAVAPTMTRPPEGCAVAPMTTRPVVTVVVDDLPVVVAG